MLLTLIRHGEVEGRPWVFRGRTDAVLSPEGLENLHTCVQSLPRTFTRIISSDLRRCRVFAQEWARAIGVHCDVDPRFREIDFGAWEELTPDEVQRRYPQEFACFRAAPESWPGAGGESFEQFRRRITAALNELHAAHGPHDHFAVVTHAGVIRLIMSMSLRISYTSALQLEVRHASTRQVWYEPSLACGADELTKVI